MGEESFTDIIKVYLFVEITVNCLEIGGGQKVYVRLSKIIHQTPGGAGNMLPIYQDQQALYAG